MRDGLMVHNQEPKAQQKQNNDLMVPSIDLRGNDHSFVPARVLFPEMFPQMQKPPALLLPPPKPLPPQPGD